MLNLFTPIIGLALVLNFMDEGAFEREATLIFLKNLALSLGGSFLILVSLFFALMENKYRKTFFSTESGGQLTRRLFLEGDNNMKASVFGTNKTHWMPVRDKMASWAKEGWATWEEEKPEWFTDMWKASVPEDMKPTKKNEEGDESSGRFAEEQVRKGGLLKPIERTAPNTPSPVLIRGSAKVSPAKSLEVNENQKINVAEFQRNMKRRGSFKM